MSGGFATARARMVNACVRACVRTCVCVLSCDVVNSTMLMSCVYLCTVVLAESFVYGVDDASYVFKTLVEQFTALGLHLIKLFGACPGFHGASIQCYGRNTTHTGTILFRTFYTYGLISLMHSPCNLPYK